MITDITVIGAGPGGASAAGLLSQLGYGVVLCEQKVFPREKVCGEFMSPHALPVLERLGLKDAFEAAAGPGVSRVLLFPAAGPAIEGAMTPTPVLPRALSRATLDLMLTERAKALGATILQPCHVQEVTGNAHEGMRVVTVSGEVKAKVVVLGHGLWQRGGMEAAAGRSAAEGGGSYVAFKAHFAECDLPANAIAIGGAPGMYAGLVETSGDGPRRYSFALVVKKAVVEEIGSGGDAQMTHLMRHNEGFARSLGGAKRLGTWMAAGPVVPGPRETYRDGRFFVGNAAGEVHTIVGEGITLAMRSALVLANAFGPGREITPGSLDEVGEAYGRAWRREFYPRYRAAQFFAHLLMRPALTSLATVALDYFPELFALCIRRSGKWPIEREIEAARSR